MAKLVLLGLAVLTVTSIRVVKTSHARRESSGALTKDADEGSSRVYAHGEPTFQSEKVG